VKQLVGAKDGAMLLRGVDRYNHFEHEPSPKADFDSEAIAYHQYAMNRLNQVTMRGTDREPRA
jgi:hypothetical protein